MSLLAISSHEGTIDSSSTNYGNARAGTGTLDPSAFNLFVGQKLWGETYECLEGFLRFDTSSIPDDAVILSAVLELHIYEDQSNTEFTVEARSKSWYPLGTEDFVSWSALAGLTLLATRNTSAGGTTYTFTSEEAFKAAVNKTGYTEILLNSSRHRAGVAPIANEWIHFYDHLDSGYEPTLYVTYQHGGEAALVGVATFTADGGVKYGGEAALQGVGVASAEGCNVWGGTATLQGVGHIEAEPLGVVIPDFSRYDAYIEDEVGSFGVIYYEDEGARKSTVSKDLTPVRQDTGANPFEIRPESGDMFSQGDFSHGAGQRYYHHEGRDSKKFLRSEGFDITEPGRLKHLHDVAQAFADTNVGRTTSIGGVPFVVSGYDVKRGNGSWPGSWTPEDPEVAETPGPVYDLTSSGSVGYAALGTNGIHKRDGGTWTHYSDAQAKRVLWAKGRLMAASDTAIYEITGGGAAPTAIKTLPTGWTWDAIFEAGAFIYASAINTSDVRSEIYIFAPNTDNTAIELKGSQEFPYGQLVRGGCGYLNVVLLGAGKKNTDGGYDPVLYRGVPDDSGFLEYIKVAEEEGSGAVDCSVRAFLPLGESIVFGWSLGSGSGMGAARGGLGVFHLGTNAFATYLKGTSAANPVESILAFGGRVIFSLASTGLYYEDTSKLVSAATLISSVADWNNAGSKLWESVELAHNPLPAEAWVRLHYCAEVPTASTTWAVGLTSETDGSKGSSMRMSNPASRLFALKLESHSNTAQTAAPDIVSYGALSYPYPTTRKYSLVRYVRLQDIDQKDMHAEPIRQDSSAVYERLLGLAYAFVNLYEPGLVWAARVERVGGPEPYLPPFDPSEQRAGDFYVVQLTLTATL